MLFFAFGGIGVINRNSSLFYSSLLAASVLLTGMSQLVLLTGMGHLFFAFERHRYYYPELAIVLFFASWGHFILLRSFYSTLALRIDTLLKIIVCGKFDFPALSKSISVLTVCLKRSLVIHLVIATCFSSIFWLLIVFFTSFALSYSFRRLSFINALVDSSIVWTCLIVYFIACL